MTIILSQKDFWELFHEAEQNGNIAYPSSNCEITLDYPKCLAKGYCRDVQLRPGLLLSIEDYVNQEYWLLKNTNREHPLEFHFQMSGIFGGISAGKNYLFSSGLAPAETIEYPANQHILAVIIHMDPQLLGTFVAGQSEPLPKALKPLVKSIHELYDIYSGKTTPTMQMALQQILNCPYQGLTKRMYLESKVIELMALQFKQFLEDDKSSIQSSILQSDDIERIHQAKDILSQNLDKSPSLLELARQVGLNDCTLKQGFRQVFGTTAFGYLRECRMERARQLLATGQTSVKEAAQAVGYASPTSFNAAFRRKFGTNPRSYSLSTQRTTMEAAGGAGGEKKNLAS